MAMRRALARHRGQLGNGGLLLAISGGADSMAMLLASAEVGARTRHRMVAAHFSHGLRPTADRRERASVRRAAASLGVPFTSGAARSPSDEAGAREARYRFLADAADAHGAVAVLTAHTQDDQAETVLLRLTRGSGLRGAGAIRECSERNVDGRALKLLRPLLRVTRAETEAVCAEAGVRPARDATNRSLRYARNRVRLRVLRDLAALNPHVRAALAGFAERAADDDALLDQLAAEAVGEVEERSESSVSWPKSALRTLPPALLPRVLERAWRSLHGDGATLGQQKLAQAAHVVARGGRLSLGRSGSLSVGPGPLARITIEQGE
ncbi:MAG: tRNA lysidine(34) synthetase TilS [Chloroflexi bacterium]|nr:tRNA lysidine(34) synthetase TilS [Chloroflexota bacterium]